MAVELDDALDRIVIAEEGERRDHGAGTHAGDDVELRARQIAADAAPAFQHAGAERAPVAAAGDDQEIDGRRRLAAYFRHRDLVVGALQEAAHQRIEIGRATGVLLVSCGKQLVLLAFGPARRRLAACADCAGKGGDGEQEVVFHAVPLKSGRSRQALAR